jgi:tetratricopeptide (TPR) repeat protein
MAYADSYNRIAA